MANSKINYGGQAVMEGVMMLGQKTAATAVRRPNGQIIVRNVPRSKIYTGKLRKTPFIRGIIVLIESLVTGLSGLLYSANVALEEEDEKIEGGTVWFIMIFATLFAVGLFFLAPLFLTNLVSDYIESSLLFNLVEGVIRLGIFLLYLWLISLMKDVRRTFEFHGAEHKTINAYERGEPLEAECVSKYSTAHPRCGTAFLLAVVLLAILVFALVGKQETWIMILSRILLLPVIAALGYEYTQLGARHMDKAFMKVLMAPGLWLQKLTTREPDNSQLEVAIAALKEVLATDQESVPASASGAARTQCQSV
jgi:uncharacterized protein YqhQ